MQGMPYNTGVRSTYSLREEEIKEWVLSALSKDPPSPEELDRKLKGNQPVKSKRKISYKFNFVNDGKTIVLTEDELRNLIDETIRDGGDPSMLQEIWSLSHDGTNTRSIYEIELNIPRVEDSEDDIFNEDYEGMVADFWESAF